MALRKMTLYWFACDDPTCEATSDAEDGSDDSFAGAMNAANAIGWRVTHLYAFCPEHAHRYRDDAQRRQRARQAVRS